MEINRLKTFLVIAKNGSFKSAAELLFLSPRAVSKQMDQLENELGVKLFIRRHNNTDLIPTGSKFVIAAEDIVNTYNDELIRIQTEQQTKEKRLRIGFSSSNQEITVQKMLIPLLKTDTDIKLEFRQESGQRLQQLVHTGTLDIAVSPYYYMKTDMTDPSLSRIDLAKGNLVVGISALNKLAHANAVSLTDLRGLEVLYYSPYASHYLKKIFYEKFDQAFPEQQINRVSSLELRDMLIAANQGIGFYPSPFLALEQRKNPLIKFLPITDDVNTAYSSTLFYKKSNQNMILQQLIQQLSKANSTDSIIA
ncbi:LysR family transcriptional regulator [Lactiplantibacillus pentosus]|uniref:LysR family transcriptional regulator n=1 Tax=Lactiplantibacillus pentosus TaxID=1589 RepID=UPI0021A5CFCE|nr:LysR family transcriptional regulator [Lactiplantibacillus pentosus]MCT3296199.1 LysR family transcriptional regulator [Lactiplantibacillus pentosus]